MARGFYIVAVLVFLIGVFAKDVHARVDLPAHIPEHVRAAVLDLPPEIQAQIQAEFDRIYSRIKLPTDPSTPPRVMLVNSQAFAVAFVYSQEPSLVFFEAHRLLSRTNEDRIAGTYAHEIQHFDPKQEQRTSFVNEVDAEMGGIARRIFRSETKSHDGQIFEAMPYNPDTIIEEYSDHFGFDSSHPNQAHIAAGLIPFYGIERQRRKHPEITTPNPFLKFSQAIHTALESTTPIPAQANMIMGFVQEQKAVADLFRPFHELAVEASTALKDALGEPSENLDASKIAKIDQAINELYVLIGGINTNPSAYNELAQLPPNFFTELGSSLETLETKLEHLSHPPRLWLLTQNVRRFRYAETYINHPEAPNPFSPPNCLAYDRATILNYSCDFFYFISSRLNFERFLKAARAAPELHLPMLVFLSRMSDLLPDGYLIQETIDEISRTLDVESVLRKIEEGQIILGALIVLDGEKSGKHQLDSQKRKEIIERLHSQKDSSPDKEVVSHLLRKDTDLLRHFLWHSDFNQAMKFISECYESLPHAEIDDALAAKIESLVQVSKERRLHAIEAHLPKDFLSRSNLDPMEVAGISTQALADVVLAVSLAEEIIIDDDRILVSKAPKKSDLKQLRAERVQDWLRTTGRDIDSSNLREFSSDRESWKTRLPKTAKALTNLFLTSPYFFINYSLTKSWPWHQILPQLSNEDLHRLTLGLSRNHAPNIDRVSLIDELYLELSRRLAAGKLNNHEILELTRLLIKGFSGSSFQSSKLIAVIEVALKSLGDQSTVLDLLAQVPSFIFPNGKAYSDFMEAAVRSHLAPRLNHATAPERAESLSRLREIVRGGCSGSHSCANDTILQARTLNRISEVLAARPEERPLLTLTEDEFTKPLQENVEAFNAILKAYSDLKPDQKWELLQWCRGKSTSLDEPVRRTISTALMQSLVYVSPSVVEAYLRQRFDEMSPLVRASFFLMGLTDNSRILDQKSFVIEAEIFSGLDGETKKTAHEVYRAARSSFPDVFRNFFVALLFSESGKRGSPEAALHLAFSKLGVLFKKFGQNLAFDRNLPESYRREVQKLWDEVEPYTWWEVQDLLHMQYGDIESAGFRLVAIRNSGTTEITVELSGPDGKHYVSSVQREALERSAEVDTADLTKMIRFLTAGEGQRSKYGFLKMHLRDASETLQTEFNRNHKREVSQPMLDTYQQAIKRLGGRGMKLKGWAFAGETFRDFPLSGGRNLVVRDIAPGVPFKSLQASNPRLYSELTELILSLEIETQNGSEGMIDKDRMPGQYFVDTATKTITILDHGQARRVAPERVSQRDAFIGSALIGDSEAALKILQDLHPDTAKIDRGKFARDLAATPEAERPMKALQLVEDQLQESIDTAYSEDLRKYQAEFPPPAVGLISDDYDHDMMPSHRLRR